MGDFFSPPPGFSEPPPEPDAPPPNFMYLGANWGIGLAKSGFLQGIWQGFVEAFTRAIASVLGWLMGAAADIAIFVMNRFTAADEKAQSSYGPLVQATLNNLFGVTVDAATVAGFNNASNRQQLGNAVGAYVMQTILQPPTGAGGSGVPPSDAAPKQFLGNMTHMAIEGWLHSWLFDALTVHELEKFGDLKDVMTRVLGIGRLSRQMFAAPIKVFVHDPYTALLNQKYRPKAIGEKTIMTQYFAGNLARGDLSTLLGNEGYSEKFIEMLIADNRKLLSNEDINFLLAQGSWSNDDAAKYLIAQGYDSTVAYTHVQIMNYKRTEPYRKGMLEAAESAFIAGNIGYDQLQTISQSVGLTGEELQWMLKVAGMKQEFKIKRITEGEIIKGIEDGILNLNDFRKWAVDHQMPLNEEQILELEIQFNLNKQSAAAAAKAAAAQAKAAAAQAKVQAAVKKAAQAAALAPDKGVTAAQAETLVKDGLWTFQQLTAFLTAKGYGQDAINSIVELLHAKMGATAAGAGIASGVRTAAAAKGLNLAEVEKAVVEGIYSIGDLQAWLTSHGFSATDSAVLVQLVEHAVQDAQTKAAAKAAAAAKSGNKGISLAELEHAARLGLTSIATYTAALQKADFDQMSITLLVGILKDQMAKDQATAAKRTAAIATAGGRGISLAQLEAEIVAGIRPIADYTAALATLGYSVSDQTDLAELLQVKVDAAKANAAKRTAAAAALAQRGISLTQAERAVKLGVVPIATYQGLLKAAGFSADAIDTLSKTLLAEVATSKQAQTAANIAAGKLATKGISLPDIERAVIAGLEPIANYTAALTAGGYSTGDAHTLTSLLQLKVDQAARAKAAHADAEGKATQRGISLASEEAAVVAGDRTLADYNALLTAMGFDAIDVATLDDLLQVKIAAAAAKAAKAAGASTSSTPPPAP